MLLSSLFTPRRFAALAVFVALAVPAVADGKSDLDAALTAVRAGDLDAALTLAEKVGATDPWRGDARFCAAWVHAQKGRHDKAAAAYQEVVKLRPSDSRAWNNLGASLDEIGKLPEAVKAYDSAIAADPRYAPAYNNKGVSLDRLGEGREAAKAFEKAIEIDAEYAAPHNNLGAWYYQLGRRRDAAAAWARAAELDPSYVSPIVNSAVLDFEGDQELTAETRLWNLVRSGRATADVWFNLGVFAYKRGAVDKALECMEEADVARPLHAETLNNMGVLYYLQGGADRRAELALRKCVEKDPKMAKAWDNLGLVLYRGGRYKDARESFEQEVALAADSGVAHYNLGCALAAEGNVPGATLAFETATTLAPDHVESLHNLAVLMGERKDRESEQQLSLLRRVVKADEKYAAGHLSLGRFYQSDPVHRDLELAFKHYEKYVRLERGSPDTVAEVVGTMRLLRDRMNAGR